MTDPRAAIISSPLRQDNSKLLRALGRLALLLGLLALASPGWGQQARWKQLQAHYQQLAKDQKYAEAMPVAEEMMKVAKASFGEGSPQMAEALVALGNAKQATGQYPEAEKLLQKAVALDEKNEGKDGVHVALHLNDLAGYYEAMGNYKQASALFHRALAIQEAKLPPDSLDLATTLHNLGMLDKVTGNFKEGEAVFQRAIAIREKKLGPESAEVASSMNNLAGIYRFWQKYPQARELFEKALAIREKVLPPDHPDIGESCNDYGEFLRAMEEYGRAEVLAKRALAIYEKLEGPEGPDISILVDNLAVLYHSMGRMKEAEQLYQRALALDEKLYGPEHPNVGNDCDNLGDLYREQGRYQEAEAEFQRALHIWEKAVGPEHPNVALATNNLAFIADLEGRYAEAEALYRRALAVQEKVQGPESPDVANSLSNLAVVYDDQGKYAEAEQLYLRALHIKEKVMGPWHTDVAFSANNLGLLYQQQGKYKEAEALLERALHIWEKAQGPEHPQVALALNNLAGLYQEEGRYAEAEPLIQRGLAIREKALSPEHPDVADSLRTLAQLYRAEGKYKEAEPLYQRSLSIWEKKFGPEHAAVARTLNDLGVLYNDEHQYAQAEPLYERALRIHEKAFGGEHPSVATDLANLAQAYRGEGKYSQAEPLYERALTIREKALGPEHPVVAQLLDNFADMRAGEGEPQQAEALYERAYEILFRQFQYLFNFMSERERLAFLGTVSSRFPGYFSFVHRYRDQDPALAGKMYDLLLWEKGFIAGSETALRRRVEASGDPEALKLLDQLAAKRTQIAALINAQPKNREAWRKLIEQLQGEANDLEKALVARSGAFAQQEKLDRATWQQVRDALQPGEAAVEFVRFRFRNERQWTDTSYYVALVVTRETRDHPQYVVLGEAKQLEGAPLVEFQQQVQARGMETAGAATISPGPEAYRLFWKPLEKALAGKTRIYLAPDGVLNQMPLGLIPAPDHKLLMQKYDLRLVSSTKDLLRGAATPATNTAVLVGNPAFDLSEAQQRAALQTLAAPQKAEPVQMASLAPGERSRDQGAGTSLPPLPGTGTEIREVGELLDKQQWQAASFTGERALEEAVKQARGPRLLHLATHGFFLPDQASKSDQSGAPSGLEDPMLRSGLFFAGADRALAHVSAPEDLDDGVLTAYEATGLNLQGTELVVLSACNTGQGEVKNGEGVFGLRRALQEAGAQAVMMSLWPVPDRETQELMTRFYQKWLAGMEKHEALRQAELQERAVVRKRYGRDLPYYWGAFVLVGR